MLTTSYSWSTALTSVNGRTGSTQTKMGAGLVQRCAQDQYRQWCWRVQMGLKKGALLKSWAHTMIFQNEIYAIKAYVMESIEKGYTGRNIYALSNSRNHQGP